MPIQWTIPHRKSVFEPVSAWWRDWMAKSSARSELRCCGEDELKRIARDVGVSVAELHNLASREPHSADLLLRRMAELDLDREEVARTAPRTFQDLQRVCTLCDARRRCARDFDNHSTDQWQSYCPNATTLMALNAQPWVSRGDFPANWIPSRCGGQLPFVKKETMRIAGGVLADPKLYRAAISAAGLAIEHPAAA